MDLLTLLHKSVLYIEGLAFIIGMINIRKYWHTSAKYVPVYLFLVVSVELYCLNTANDQWMYNLLGIIELFIFSFIFYRSVNGKLSKKLIVVAFVSGVLFLLADFLFITESFKVFLSYAFGFVSLMISLMCFVYLFEMTKTERVLHQYRVLLFWIVIGLLVFHLCNLPVTVVVNHLMEIGNVPLILTIQTIASIGIYFCFIIGFIWTQKSYNT